MERALLSSIQSSPSLSLPLSKQAHLSQLKTIGLLVLPLSYGKLKASHSNSFLIKAVLADTPSAPPAEQKELAESRKRKIAFEVSPGSGSSLKARNVVSTSQNDMGLTDTSLESTWVHRIWITAGCSAMGGMVIKSMQAVDSTEAAMGAIMAALIAYLLADLGTGVYHWGVDNYGDAGTPIFGPQIDAFQGHHKRPWTITKRQFANNIHALARPATFALAPFLLLPNNVYVDSFLGVFLACVVFSQQFHSWAHSKKTDLPAIVIKLQDMGVLVPRKMHGAHHRSPYNVNYCIVSGLWNPLLDRANFFSRLERFIYATWGVRPRCWSETSMEWLQEGSYFSDGTDLDDTWTR